MRIEDGFHQTPFPDGNPYTSDPVLSSLLRRLLPPTLFAEVDSSLIGLGDEIVRDIRPLAPTVKSPVLVQYNEWGQRIDSLRVSEGWSKLTDFTIKHAFVAISHERPHGEHSRIHAFAKSMVMTGDAQVIYCPFSMTDGAARVIDMYGTDAMKRELLPRLISRTPAEAYISGQWMTERPGGSDVALTETTATPVSSSAHLPSDLGPPYLLSGFKWFASAADGNMALALARTGAPHSGSRGLSLFVVPLRLAAPSPHASPLANGVRIHRLKNKFGTVGVPTAELELHDTRAWRVGEEGAGVRTIAAMLNITRVHSAITSVGSLARALAIARSYSTVRAVNGGTQLLCDNPLHVSVLADVSVLYRGLVHLAFGTVRILGRVEANTADAGERLRLRIMTPVAKGFAAMRSVSGMEESMAALGGMGYMDEVGIGCLIRDAMVEKIWEGTVPVLALDLLRAAKAPGAVEALVAWASGIVKTASSLNDAALLSALDSAIHLLPRILSTSAKPNALLPLPTLTFVGSLSTTLHLLEHAVWSRATQQSSHDVDMEAVRRWAGDAELGRARKDVEDVLEMTERGVAAKVKADQTLVYGTGEAGGRARL